MGTRHTSLRRALAAPVLVIWGLLLAACGGGTVAASPVATSSPTPTPPASPSPVAAAPNQSCAEVSFFLDPALGTGIDCTTVPGSPADNPLFDLVPEHTQARILGYPVSGTRHEPSISVFDVEEFALLVPEVVEMSVFDLRSLLSEEVRTDGELPFLPIYNAGQMFTSRFAIVESPSTAGIEYLTQFAQGIGPIANSEVVFTYQGLTADGKYWVSVILPFRHPQLADDALNPPPGQSWEQFEKGYAAYIASVTKLLNEQAPGSFTPSLIAAQQLVASLVVAS